jgi:hypothetical protein
VMSTSLSVLVRDVPSASRKLVDTGAAAGARRKLSEQGVTIRDAHPSDRKFLFVISSEEVDLAGDVITIDGIDSSNFGKNPAVLNAHDSSTLPIAVSTPPAALGKTLTAVAKFPRPGVSQSSDQIAAAIRASLVKGASIGFVPVRWSFSKNPERPFGVDFHQIRLLEWSICAVPCNPACLYIGAVEGGSASRSSSRRDDPARDRRLAEVRQLRSMATK